MSRLIIDVDNEVSKIIGDVDITSGDISTVDIEFKFSAEWDGYKKTVLLYKGVYEKEEATWLILNDDILPGSAIPKNLLEKPGFLSIGVFGDNDNSQRISANIVTKRIAPGSHSEDVEEEVDYSLYNQIIRQLIELERTAEAFDISLAQGIEEITNLSTTKEDEIEALAANKINAITDLVTGKINDINALTQDKLNVITNSVNGHMTNMNNAASSHISNIANVVNSHIDNLARIVGDHIANMGREANGAINNINNVTNTNMGNINRLTQDSQNAITQAVNGHMNNLNNAVNDHMTNISNAAQGHINNLNSVTNTNLNSINQRTEEKKEELETLEDMILFDLGLLREVHTDWQTLNANTFVVIALADVDYITVKTDPDVPCMYFTYALDDTGNRIPIEGANFKITKDEWGANSYFSVYIADSSDEVRNRKVAVTKVSTFTKID